MKVLVLVVATFGLAYSGLPTEDHCIKDGDITFLLDSGSGVTMENLMKMKDVVTNAVSFLALGPDDAQVAIVTFGGFKPLVPVHFKHSTSMEKFNKKMEHVKKIGGGSKRKTGYALKRVMELAFKPDNGNREDKKDYIIFFMTGDSVRHNNLAKQAKILKDAGITIVVVAIGELSQEQLEIVASDSRLIFKFPDFDSLPGFVYLFKRMVLHCNCMKKADILFMLSTGKGVTPDNFMIMKSAVKKIVSWIDVGPEKAQIAMAAYGARVKSAFNFKRGITSKQAEKAIGKFTKMAGGSHKTFKTFGYMAKNFFKNTKGDRPNVDNYLVIFMAEKSKRHRKFIKLAKKFKAAGNTVIVVAIGDKVPQDQLEAMASEPLNAIRIQTFIEMPIAVEAIKNIALNCDVNEGGEDEI